MQSSTIIPVAGGKGGVGKTLVTANLAAALAQQGHPVIAVDLDLGGSNLHTHFGLPNRNPGIGDFLRNGGGPLSDYLVSTGIENLRFLPGDGRMPFMANITFHQKRTLVRELKKLPARYILLDLSAGSSYNTLDFFRIAPCGLVVTVPERPSIMNALIFLKNLVQRAVNRAVHKDPSVLEAIQSMYVQSMEGPPRTVAWFRKQVAEVNAQTAEKIDAVTQQFRPRFVYNMGRTCEDLRWTSQIEQSLWKHLSIRCGHFGFLPYDPLVRQGVDQGRLLLELQPEGTVSSSIRALGSRVERFWTAPVANSGELLLNATRKMLESDSKEPLGESTPRS